MTLQLFVFRYLLQHGYEQRAHSSILFFYGCNDYEADNYLHELKNNMRQNVRPLGMFEVLRHNDTRRPTIVGAMTAFAMTFSGVAGKLRVFKNSLFFSYQRIRR